MQKDRKLSPTANLLIAALCAVITGLAASTNAPALAGAANDFFGSSVPDGTAGGQQAQQAKQASSNPYADPQMPQGDFTADEKRMQKKYKASVQHCKNLIAKGEKMMESGQRGKNDKDFKKGKILKEIGEKQLAELTANNPFADLLDEKGSDKKPKTASSDSSSTQ